MVESTTGKDRRHPQVWIVRNLRTPTGRAMAGQDTQWRPSRHERTSDPARPRWRLPGAIRSQWASLGAFGLCRRSGERCPVRVSRSAFLEAGAAAQPQWWDAAPDNTGQRNHGGRPPSVPRWSGGCADRALPDPRRIPAGPGCAHPPLSHQHARGPHARVGRAAAQAAGTVDRPAARAPGAWRRIFRRAIGGIFRCGCGGLGAFRRGAAPLHPAVCGA
jgi:hypothetical protein